MNYASCGAPATTIPSVFHPREKGIFAAKSRTVALYFIKAGAVSGKRTV